MWLVGLRYLRRDRLRAEGRAIAHEGSAGKAVLEKGAGLRLEVGGRLHVGGAGVLLVVHRYPFAAVVAGESFDVAGHHGPVALPVHVADSHEKRLPRRRRRCSSSARRPGPTRSPNRPPRLRPSSRTGRPWWPGRSGGTTRSPGWRPAPRIRTRAPPSSRGRSPRSRGWSRCRPERGTSWRPGPL